MIYKIILLVNKMGALSPTLHSFEQQLFRSVSGLG